MQLFTVNRFMGAIKWRYSDIVFGWVATGTKL